MSTPSDDARAILNRVQDEFASAMVSTFTPAIRVIDEQKSVNPAYLAILEPRMKQSFQSERALGLLVIFRGLIELAEVEPSNPNTVAALRRGIQQAAALTELFAVWLRQNQILERDYETALNDVSLVRTTNSLDGLRT